MKNKLIKSLFALLILGFVSCGEESNMSPYYQAVTETNAKVKFEHVAVGPAGINFNVNWFINDTKTSGALTTTGLTPLFVKEYMFTVLVVLKDIPILYCDQRQALSTIVLASLTKSPISFE